jgi:hypothetical protein
MPPPFKLSGIGNSIEISGKIYILTHLEYLAEFERKVELLARNWRTTGTEYICLEDRFKST